MAADGNGGTNGNGSRAERLAHSTFSTLLYRGVTTGIGLIILGLMGWTAASFISVRDDMLIVKTSYSLELPILKERLKEANERLDRIEREFYRPPQNR